MNAERKIPRIVKTAAEITLAISALGGGVASQTHQASAENLHTHNQQEQAMQLPNGGDKGYLGKDGDTDFPVWTLVALGLGSVALAAGGLVTKHIGPPGRENRKEPQTKKKSTAEKKS